MARTKYLKVKHQGLVSHCPNFSATGSIKGMKDRFYGKDALLVRCGSYIYNVTNSEQGRSAYYNLAT